MPSGIIIFGLNGSGKSTICKELAKSLNYKFMDIEDYFFEVSEIPYTKERTRDECIQLMLDDIIKHQNFVLSALAGDFTDEITSMYNMGVYLKVPKSIRIQRVEQRQIKKFGNRIKSGGDMYESNEKFLLAINARTHKRINRWLEDISCPIIQIDGTKEIEENVSLIIQNYFEILNEK